ncbi:M13-type metalloendopeptidase [Streptococcus tangpeifui]|uniref:M13-type metalloendopeptidase n=1 Tax=Streptococcus tangpeifui TaxID=2709400 RepID=UPI0024074ABF|nr:M13-type metalloendopeptidase [Streptococcus sp. ZJ1593]
MSFREVGYVQYYKSVIPTDVHAPAELRVNQVVKNMDDFYKAYDIKKGDKMYMDKKDRLTIW